MSQNLIYPDKRSDTIVRVRCKNCQHQGEIIDFSSPTTTINTCPKCGENKRLVMICNNQTEIDLERNKLTTQQYLTIMVVTMVIFILYKLLTFQLWLILSTLILVVYYWAAKRGKINKK